MRFDDPECLGDIGSAHAGDVAYPRRASWKSQIDDDFLSCLPYVHVWRTVLARWEIDDDAKSILLQNHRHRINKPSVGFLQTKT